MAEANIELRRASPLVDADDRLGAGDGDALCPISWLLLDKEPDANGEFDLLEDLLSFEKSCSSSDNPPLA